MNKTRIMMAGAMALAFGMAIASQSKANNKPTTVTRYEQVTASSCLSRQCSDIFNNNVCYTSGNLNNLRTSLVSSTTCGAAKETAFIYRP